MDLEMIRNGIVLDLHNYVQKPIVMFNHNAPKPHYPYITYNFALPYNQNGENSVCKSKLAESEDPSFEFDILETRTKHVLITMSIDSYSMNALEAHNLAKKAYDWFRHVGYTNLKNLNLVVQSIEGFAERDTLIVGDYERRVGFDIILRTTDTIERRIETIEEYKIEEELVI